MRKHILSYKMPALSLVPSSSSESDQALARQNAVAVLKFMEELRILFSLLVGSKRKYVNPQKPVEVNYVRDVKCDNSFFIFEF